MALSREKFQIGQFNIQFIFIMVHLISSPVSFPSKVLHQAMKLPTNQNTVNGYHSIVASSAVWIGPVYSKRSVIVGGRRQC